ncbi:hypothetical protein [Aquihabitans sp. McL0605]|uniref:hypothetical protein n=1 Tax=Aquihabitans sp. McL0605 TaxID=3415671 RepID=UPI003CF1E492
MGSSKSKPRKGHQNPQHLPKVGTPQNLEWRHEGERKDAFGVFGGKWTAIIIAVLVVAAAIGLIFITA